MKIFLIPAAIVLFNLNFSLGQTDTSTTDIEESVENVLEEATDESGDNFLLDEYENFIKHPINLNDCTIEELSKLPLLDLPDAVLIIEHRKKFGMFISTSELFSVEHLNAEKVKKLIPFVFANPAAYLAEQKIMHQESLQNYVNFSYRSRIISDLQPRAGFLEHKFQGNKIKFYNRAIFEFDNTYQLSILSEKDA